MMIDKWNLQQNEISKVKNLSGRYSGLLTNNVFYFQGSNVASKLNVCTALLPNFEKYVISPNAEISYHLSGYGYSFNDSLVRLGGESVERAAGVLAQKYLANRIFESSYLEVCENAVDKKYLMPYTVNQLKRINNIRDDFRSSAFDVKEKLLWIRTKSLYSPKNEVIVPANDFLFGMPGKDVPFLSVSTGTAAHVTWEKALTNSIIEYIQIDSFTSTWYSNKKVSGIYLDELRDEKLKEKITNLMGNLTKKYDVLILNYSEFAIIPVYIFGVFIISKSGHNIPAISFGLQGGLEVNNTVYRAFCEYLENKEMSESNYINFPKFEDVDMEKIVDFDKNVAFFANPNNYKKNKKIILSKTIFCNPHILLERKKHITSLRELLISLKHVAPKASFLDITPPYVNNYRVARVFIPELLAMTFPSFPQLNHPRLKNEDTNYEFYIHPMP